MVDVTMFWKERATRIFEYRALFRLSWYLDKLKLFEQLKVDMIIGAGYMLE